MRPLFALFPRLRVPFEPFAALPTPLERLDALSRERGADLWVKRDDRTHPLHGGTKMRNLEFFLPRARDSGRTVVAVGMAHSNWIRGVERSGLPARIVAIPWLPSGNEKWGLTPLSGARAAVAMLGAVPGLLAGRSLLAPIGGTDAGTTLGYVNAALELADQSSEPFEAVYVPLGSGGLAAGLALGLALAGLPTEVRAVRVSMGVVASDPRVRGLAAAAAGILGVRCPPLRLSVLGAYLGPGYAAPTRAAERARRLFPLPLDPTYSAKAAAAFLEGPERRRLFWLSWAPREAGSPREAEAPRV